MGKWNRKTAEHEGNIILQLAVGHSPLNDAHVQHGYHPQEQAERKNEQSILLLRSGAHAYEGRARIDEC